MKYLSRITGLGILVFGAAFLFSACLPQSAPNDAANQEETIMIENDTVEESNGMEENNDAMMEDDSMSEDDAMMEDESMSDEEKRMKDESMSQDAIMEAETDLMMQ